MLAQILDVLAYLKSGNFSNIGAIILLLLYAFILALIIVGLVRLVRYLGSARKEQQLMRMELTKIAGEVELLRKKLTDISSHQNNSE